MDLNSVLCSTESFHVYGACFLTSVSVSLSIKEGCRVHGKKMDELVGEMTEVRHFSMFHFICNILEKLRLYYKTC